jgi:hypothetical protein
MCASGRIARHPRHCPVIASPQPLLKAIQQPVSRWFREHGGNPDGVKPQISSFALYGLAYRHGESDDSWTSPHVLESVVQPAIVSGAERRKRFVILASGGCSRIGR